MALFFFKKFKNYIKTYFKGFSHPFLYSYEVKHISRLIENSNGINYAKLKKIILVGKSKLLLDQRNHIYSDWGLSNNFEENCKKYFFHEELFGAFKYDVKSCSILSSLEFDRSPRFISGNCISLLHHGSENWMHWISEILPKLFLDSSIINKNITLLIDDDMPLNMMRSLKFIARENKIIKVKRFECVRPEVLFLPRRSGYCLMWYRNYYEKGVWGFDSKSILKLRSFLKRFRVLINDKNKKLYSIRDSNFREIINKKDLMAALKDLNFKIQNPAKLNFFEKIKAYRYTDILVTQAGSNLANLIFMPKGSLVIALAAKSKWVHYKYFEDYASILGIKLIYFLCSTDSNLDEKEHQKNVFSIEHPSNADILCNIKELIYLIKKNDK